VLDVGNAFLLTVIVLTTAPSSGQEKASAPADTSQQQALALVKEVYGQEWESAKTSAKKQALATKLLQKAGESTDDTNRYVLLKVARDVAAQAGDAELAFKAVEAMSTQYEVDAYKLKGSALSQAAKSATLRSHRIAVAKRCLELICAAVKKDDFVAAKYLGGLAADAARKARDSLVTQIDARNEEVEEIAEAYADIPEALAKLDIEPDDPDANLAVGKYHCFFKGNWDRGLPMLALGSDEKLKELAVMELRDVPDPEGQVSLGHAWWEMASARNGVAKKQLEGRAAHWYRKALPRLKPGLKKDIVIARLPEQDQQGPQEPKPRPRPKPRPPKRIRVDLSNEKNVTELFTLGRHDRSGGRWRFEPQGLRLSATSWMTSKQQFVGDFTLDLVYHVGRSDGFDGKVEITLWGETVAASGRNSNGPKAVRVQRQGQQIICQPVGGRPRGVIIKEEFKDRPSTFTIRAYRHWQYSGTMDVLFQSMGFEGRTSSQD
jgi:hypothetical protein